MTKVGRPIGCIGPNKGIPRTESVRKKVSVGLRNYYANLSEVEKAKLKANRIAAGKKISSTLRGRPSKCKGRTYEDIYGRKEASRIRLERSLSLKGKPKSKKHRAHLWMNRSRSEFAAQVSQMKRAMTPEQKERRLKKFLVALTPAARKRISEANCGKKRSPQTCARIASARAKRKFPFNNTKPEMKVRKYLRKRGVHFRSQQRVAAYRLHAFDFVLFRYGILVEVDGCYWHGCPIHYPNTRPDQRKRDMRIDKIVCAKGWTVVRLWEHEILAGKFNKLHDAINVARRERRGRW